jgi:hypothetical protein
LFDSHKREIHNGAAFLLFKSENEVNAYLSKLFPSVDVGEDQGQDYMYNSFEARIFKSSEYFKEHKLPPPLDFAQLELTQKLTDKAQEAQEFRLALEAKDKAQEAQEFRLALEAKG